MKWYSKIFYWEKHRIPLNILLIAVYYLGIWFSKEFILPEDQYERPDLMFYSVFLFFILLGFNVTYFFTWIGTLYYDKDDFKLRYKKRVRIIYIICASAIIILPLLSLLNL